MPTPDGPPHDLARLIEVLNQHGVEYLVCGGAAAQAYGAERPTQDADCVVKQERANLDGWRPPCGNCTPVVGWRVCTTRRPACCPSSSTARP